MRPSPLAALLLALVTAAAWSGLRHAGAVAAEPVRHPAGAYQGDPSLAPPGFVSASIGQWDEGIDAVLVRAAVERASAVAQWHRFGFRVEAFPVGDEEAGIRDDLGGESSEYVGFPSGRRIRLN